MKRDDTERHGKLIVDMAIPEALAKKAVDIVVFHPGEGSPIASWIIVCQGTSTVHTRAIAQGIIEKLEAGKNPAWHIEGFEEGRWILIDYVDVIVNIMLPELRGYYDLESLWSDWPRTDVKEEGI